MAELVVAERHDCVRDHVGEELVVLLLEAGDGDDDVADDHATSPGGLAFQDLALVDGLTAADALSRHHRALSFGDALVVRLPGGAIAERALEDRYHVGVCVGRRRPPHGDVEVTVLDHVVAGHVVERRQDELESPFHQLVLESGIALHGGDPCLVRWANPDVLHSGAIISL